MRRAIKPIIISLLSLALPILVICLGLWIVNIKKDEQSKFNFRIEDGHIQFTENGEYWKSIIDVDALTGKDGSEIVLQTTSTHIQWKYADEGEESWRDLLQLSKLAGLPGERGKSAYEIAVEQGFQGDVNAWLLSLNGQQGPAGPAGSIWHSGTNYSTVTNAKVGDFFYDTDDYDIYKKTADGWELISNVKGETGASKEIEVAVVSGNIQWRYKSGEDTEWKLLVSVEDLKGKDGKTPTVDIVNGEWVINGVQTGVTAEGRNGYIPYIQDGYWYINDVNQNIKAEGVDGKSAYDLAYEADNSIGTEEEWLESLKGADGKEIELKSEGSTILWKYTIETDSEWKLLLDVSTLPTVKGADGKSAYEIAKEEDPTLDTVDKWLASLKGERGTMWYTGTDIANAPTEAKEGDLYYNTVTGDVYQKSSSGWGSPVSNLKGANGAAGTKWYTGEGEPASATGAKDDLYYDTTTGDIYSKGATGWTKIGNIKGPQGSQGSQGAQGSTGPQGATGNGIESIDKIVEADKTTYKITYTNGNIEEFVVENAYTITYDYRSTESYFNDTSKYHDAEYKEKIKPSQWVTTLPQPKDEYKGDFDGWFIEGTDRQVKNYDFIGGDVTLVAKFNTGLYQDGELVKTWIELITEGTITVADNTITASDTGISGDLVISSSVTSIGDYAFENCTSLTSVTFAKESQLNDIGAYAFRNCGNLTSITIPSSVTSIGSQAFFSCDSLTSVTFEEGSQLNDIGANAFGNCDNLTSITIPSSVTSIGSRVFYSCDSLASVTFEDGSQLNDIGAYAFSFCYNLTIITIPASVTSIGECAFYSCDSLTSVTFAEGSQLTSIGNKAFRDCDNLTRITIPSSVTSIGSQAFYNCTSLTSVTFENTNGWMAGDVALSATDLANTSTAATYLRSTYYNKTWTRKDPGLYQNGVLTQSWDELTAEGGLITVADNVITRCNTSIAGDLVISSSVTSIGDYAFYNCDNLTSITIPSSVTSIVRLAFYSCGSLASVTFAEGSQLNDIGPYAFKECTSLNSIIIPASVTSIGDEAFYDCDNLTSITIPSSVTSIGSDAFYSCTSLTSVTFAKESQLNDIGTFAFRGCDNLTSITIPSSVTSIGSNAFFNCTSLTSVTFEEGSQLTSIGNGAFSSCDNLTSITIPSSVTSIGDYAFYICYSLASVTFAKESQLNDIGANAFKGCYNLTSIPIPSSVTSIGDEAFYGCYRLTNVIVAEGSQLTSIGNEAFRGCDNLTSITIPSSVTSIGDKAFSGCDNLTSVTFANTNGWMAGDVALSATDLANTSTAATYLKSTYADGGLWTRS